MNLRNLLSECIQSCTIGIYDFYTFSKIIFDPFKINCIHQFRLYEKQNILIILLDIKYTIVTTVEKNALRIVDDIYMYITCTYVYINVYVQLVTLNLFLFLSR